MFEKEKVKIVEDIFQDAENGDVEHLIKELQKDLTTDIIIREILGRIVNRDLGYQNKIIYLLDEQLVFYDKATIKKLLGYLKYNEQENVVKERVETPKVLKNEKKYKEFAEKFYKLDGRTRLERIDEILRIDIHGERNNRRLYYFLNLSNHAKRLRTLVVVRAASSAGKNYLVENVLKLFPEYEIEVYSSATAAVFNYENLGDRKTLFLKEMRESENSEEVFKSLIDGDRTHKEVVREKGKNVVVNHYLESLGIVTTLSFENVAIDLINRSWIITIDMSSSQTREISIFKRKKKRYQIEIDLYIKKIEEDRDLIKHSYTYLDWSYYVVIPYIEKLSMLFPKTPKINLRRDEDKLYNLIEIITLFNQKHRKELEIRNKKYLFSEFEDLEIALDVAQEIYIDLILHIDEVKRKIIKYFDTNEKCTRTGMHLNLLKEYSHGKKTTIRKMENLVFEGYLNKEKSSNTWYYSRINNIDLIEKMQLENLKPEIDKYIEEVYTYYKEKSVEALEVEAQEVVKKEILKKKEKILSNEEVMKEYGEPPEDNPDLPKKDIFSEVENKIKEDKKRKGYK
jgi:hypothetical protein